MADQRELRVERPPRCQVEGAGDEVHYFDTGNPLHTVCALGGIYRSLVDTEEDATCRECMRVVHGSPAA